MYLFTFFFFPFSLYLQHPLTILLIHVLPMPDKPLNKPLNHKSKCNTTTAIKLTREIQ